MDTDTIINIYSINTRFILLKLQDIELITMVSNGYVNITSLCNSRDKQFEDWKNMETSKKLIKYIEDTKQENIKLIVNIKGYKNNEILKGEYVSPELLQYVTYWISPYLGIKVSIMMRYYYRKILASIESQEDIVYGELIKTYVYKIKEKYDKQREEASKYFSDIETVIYSKLTACLLDKAGYVLFGNCSNLENSDKDIDEINKKIEDIEQELENNNNYRNTVLDIINTNHERSNIHIASLLIYNSNYKEILVQIKNYIDFI
ncbi:SWPV1-284 [Shearwaterpox virus]|uniref:SWPV1-284 n=1 Tax=Shearwaterpox virus TaxID=1974596 RepID=A0A1V0S892_CNPV|nr:SWPV1-284 [Shearwaterpox virus]